MARRGASAATVLASGPNTQPARRHGRFNARLTLDRILDELAQVAHQVAAEHGDEPRRLTMLEWDSARATRLVPGLPTAETLRQRLRRTWANVVKAALLPAANRPQFLSTQGDRNVGRHGTDGQARALEALQAVAIELPSGTRLSQHAYDAVVLEFESSSRRWRHSDPLRLPRSLYVIAKFGTWEAACAAAGVAPDASGTRYPSLPTRAEVLDDCITELGCLPSERYFDRFCRSRLISYASHRERWDETVSEARRLRAIRGETTPGRPTDTTALPLLPGAAELPTRQRIRTKADALASLRRYGEHYLTDGRSPRRAHYLHCCSGDRALVVPSAMQRFGGFQDLCREAGIA